MKLYLTKHAHRKLRYFVEQIDNEISGFGKVTETKTPQGSVFIVTDFEIFDQVVSGAHSTIDDDALAKFLFEKTKAGENMSEWKVWWHSHCRMASYFSQTDTGTMDKSTEFKYMISLVTNHKDEKTARIDVYDPIRAHSDMDVVVLEEEDSELKELCKKQIEEKVRTFSHTPSTWEQDWKKKFPHSQLNGYSRTGEEENDLDDDLVGMGFQPPLPKSASRDKGKYLTHKKDKKRSRLLD